MNHEVVEAQSFWDCVLSIRRDDTYLGNLMETLAELRTQPFQNPKLQTHDVGTARNGKKIYSSGVGGRITRWVSEDISYDQLARTIDPARTDPT